MPKYRAVVSATSSTTSDPRRRPGSRITSSGCSRAPSESMGSRPGTAQSSRVGAMWTYDTSGRASSSAGAAGAAVGGPAGGGGVGRAGSSMGRGSSARESAGPYPRQTPVAPVNPPRPGFIKCGGFCREFKDPSSFTGTQYERARKQNGQKQRTLGRRLTEEEMSTPTCIDCTPPQQTHKVWENLPINSFSNGMRSATSDSVCRKCGKALKDRDLAKKGRGELDDAWDMYGADSDSDVEPGPAPFASTSAASSTSGPASTASSHTTTGASVSSTAASENPVVDNPYALDDEEDWY